MKPITKITFLIVCILHSLSSSSQTSYVDSLKKVLQTEKEDSNKVKTLNLLAYDYPDGDMNSSLQYASEAVSLAEKINFKKGLGTAYYNTGYLNYSRNNYDESIRNLQTALKIRKETGDKRGMAEAFEYLGANYGYQAFYAEAISNTYSALTLYQELGNKFNTGECLQTLGALYRGAENYTEARKKYEESIQIRKAIGDSAGVAQSIVSVGEVHGIAGNYSEALKRYSEATAIYEKLGVNAPPWGLTMCHEATGSIQELIGDSALHAGDKITAFKNFTDAFQNYKMTLASWIQMGNKALIANSYIHMGDIQQKLQKLPEAKEAYEKALQLSLDIGEKEGIKGSYYGLEALDSMQGNYKHAYENYQKYILYRDSVVKEASTKKSLQSEMQYEFDKKSAVAKAEQDKKDAEIKRARNTQYFVIALLGVFILAVLIIVFIQYRNNTHKQKANVLLADQKQKVESALSDLKTTQSQLIQSEKMASLGELTAGIAHEIQNPLNVVNNFSDVNNELIDELKSELATGNQQSAIEIANDIKANEQKINHHGKRADAIVKGMLQHSQRNTGEKTATDINALADEYLRLSYHGLRAKDKSFNATIKTDYDESIGKINIIPQDIGRVLLNLYNNAFYAVNEKKKKQTGNYEPVVSVTTKAVKPPSGGLGVVITVRDNGSGISQNIVDKIFQPFFTTKPTGQGTGLGLSLSYDIIKAHGGEIKVESTENEFSLFILKLPL